MLVALVCILVGLLGIYGLRKLAAENVRLYNTSTAPLGQLTTITSRFQRNRRHLVMMASAPDQQAAKNWFDKYKSFETQIADVITRFEEAEKGYLNEPQALAASKSQCRPNTSKSQIGGLTRIVHITKLHQPDQRWLT